MNRMFDPPQRIARLTPLAEALAWIDAEVRPVAARAVAIEAATGLCLAQTVTLEAPRPAADLAGRDGWAVASEETLDAAGYAPALLSRPPTRVDLGELLPDGADAVAAIDAVVAGAALMAVAPGDGVLARGSDAAADEALGRIGALLRDSDIATFKALGIATVSVRRPRLKVLASRSGPMIAALASYLAAQAQRAGADVGICSHWDDTLADADGVLVVGGTGSGRGDASGRRLAGAGRLAIHGIALAPGHTAGLGTIGAAPVLLVPGEIDAGLAVWLVLGRRILARLAGMNEAERSFPARLTDKIASALGLAEFFLLRRAGDGMAPIAGGRLPLAALLAADGFVLIPPDSEGCPAGTLIGVKTLP